MGVFSKAAFEVRREGKGGGETKDSREEASQALIMMLLVLAMAIFVVLLMASLKGAGP